MRAPVPLLLLLTLVAVACGAEPAPTTTPDPVPTASADPTAATTPPSPASTPSATPSPLAGEPYEGPPLDGTPASLAVIGVAADDVLHVRGGPGIEAPVVAELDPLATRVAATGRARLLPSSIWLEVAVDGTVGWAASSYLAFLGPTDDVTWQLVEETGALPSAPTLTELARDVAALRASTDPASRIVISGAPSVSDLGEVTVDVVGLGDDAQRGERLVVFATVGEDQATVKSVEATLLCARGPATEVGCP